MSPEIFRCPVSGFPLRLATAEELAQLNQFLAGQNVRVLGDGTRLASPWQGAWCVDKTNGFYPVVHGIPILTPDALVSRDK